MPRVGTHLRDGIFVRYYQIVGGRCSGDLYVLDRYSRVAADAVHEAHARRVRAEEAPFVDKNAK